MYKNYNKLIKYKFTTQIKFKLTLSFSNHRLYLLKSILCSFIFKVELINSANHENIYLKILGKCFQIYTEYIKIPIIKFEDNFNIQQCISRSKAAVVDVIIERTEENNPKHELKIYKFLIKIFVVKKIKTS